MKFRSKAVAGMVALLFILSFSGCQKLKARDELNKGVRAFKDAKYETAVEYFKSAVDLDPDLLNAHLYLATAYAAQYVPGGESEENKRIGQEAIRAYETVLEKDPTNVGSVKGISGIYYNMKQFDKAKEYYRRTADLEPNNPEPLYSIGNVNWILCYDKQNPLPPERKIELADQGLESLKKALEIDPDYYNAYFYINLLYREKAKIVIDEVAEKNQRLKDQFALAALDPKPEEAQGALLRRQAPDRYEEYMGYLKKADENFDQAMVVKKRVEEKAQTTGIVDMTK